MDSGLCRVKYGVMCVCGVGYILGFDMWTWMGRRLCEKWHSGCTIIIVVRVCTCMYMRKREGERQRGEGG